MLPSASKDHGEVGVGSCASQGPHRTARVDHYGLWAGFEQTATSALASVQPDHCAYGKNSTEAVQAQSLFNFEIAAIPARGVADVRLLMAGDLLSRTAAGLSDGSLLSDDDHAVVQRRRAVSLLRRVGRTWPRLFAAVEGQNTVLVGAAERALRALDEHGLGPEGRRADVARATAGSLDVSRAGPLGTYATLLAELDGLVVALHDAGPAEWAHQAQRRLRRDLAAAAAIEAALLEGHDPTMNDSAAAAAGVAGSTTATEAARGEPFDDTMFDVAAVEAGAWVPGPYGPGDQRGTFNEVTPEKTAQALALLRPGEPVETYSLAETLENGFPAWGDRAYEQRLVVTGYTPAERLRRCPHRRRAPGPWPQEHPRGAGVAHLQHGHEDQRPASRRRGRHALQRLQGARDRGHTGGPPVSGPRRWVPSLPEGWWSTWSAGPWLSAGPIVYSLTLAGRPVLRSRYRITVEDIEATLAWEGIAQPIGPGDAVLLRAPGGGS